MNSQPESLGSYELLERLGTGGMGTVYRARDRRSGTIVAIKVIHDYLTSDPTIRQRFRQEAHIASLLTSPYTVRLHEYGEDQGRYYMASEFVDGVSLADILRDGPLDASEAIGIAAQVGMALHEAEARNVIHRDIKPSNILITRSDRSVKVTDFGISRLGFGPDITQPGTYLGTLAYSAPEQLRGEPDIRSDFYAVGVTLYQCFTGELPFQGNTPFQLAAAVEQTPPPIDRLGHLPQPVIDLVAKCLEKDPAARYQTAAEFGAAIETARRALAGAPTPPDQDALLQTRVDPSGAPPVATPPPAGSSSGAIVSGTPAPVSSPDPVPAAASPAPQPAAAQPVAAAASGGSEPPRGFAGALGGDWGERLPKKPMLFAFVGGAAIVLAIVVALLVRKDGDDGKNQLAAATATSAASRTATPRATATDTPDATATPTSEPEPTATLPPLPTPPPAPTVVTNLGTPPPLSFQNGTWTFNLVTLLNTCSTGPLVGDLFQVTVTITEAVTDDGYIEDLESAYLWDSDGVTFLGEALLIWPVIEFFYPLTDTDGTGVLYGEFFDFASGWGRLEGDIISPESCTRLFEENRPPGFEPSLEPTFS